jgi:hypothetical protein
LGGRIRSVLAWTPSIHLNFLGFIKRS